MSLLHEETQTKYSKSKEHRGSLWIHQMYIFHKYKSHFEGMEEMAFLVNVSISYHIYIYRPPHPLLIFMSSIMWVNFFWIHKSFNSAFRQWRALHTLGSCLGSLEEFIYLKRLCNWELSVRFHWSIYCSSNTEVLNGWNLNWL